MLINQREKKKKETEKDERVGWKRQDGERTLLVPKVPFLCLSLMTSGRGKTNLWGALWSCWICRAINGQSRSDDLFLKDFTSLRALWVTLVGRCGQTTFLDLLVVVGTLLGYLLSRSAVYPLILCFDWRFCSFIIPGVMTKHIFVVGRWLLYWLAWQYASLSMKNWQSS